DSIIAAPELHSGIGKNGFVLFRWLQRWLVSGRPGIAICHVADVAECSPIVSRAVFAPARDRDVLPAAVATSGIGEHHVVAAVRKQLNFRDRRIGTGEYAQR